MKSQLKIVLSLLVVAAAAAYFLVLKKPAKIHERVAGEVYVLPKDFVINLSADKLAKVDVALVLAAGHKAPAAEGAAPPEGYGTLPEEAVVRSIVTDELTGQSSSSLISQTGRDAMEKRIKTRILKSTDVEVNSVMLTDIAVQ